MYRQWLADIELIEIRISFGSLFQDESVICCWKAKRGWGLTINLRTPKIDYCRIYSLYVRDEGTYVGSDNCGRLLEYIEI